MTTAMPSEFIALIAKSGIFAVMFVSLLFHILSDAKKREAKYQELITKLADELAIVKNIDDEVKVINSKLVLPIRLYKERL